MQGQHPRQCLGVESIKKKEKFRVGEVPAPAGVIRHNIGLARNNVVVSGNIAMAMLMQGIVLE